MFSLSSFRQTEASLCFLVPAVECTLTHMITTWNANSGMSTSLSTTIQYGSGKVLSKMHKVHTHIDATHTNPKKKHVRINPGLLNLQLPDSTRVQNDGSVHPLFSNVTWTTHVTKTRKTTLHDQLSQESKAKAGKRRSEDAVNNNLPLHLFHVILEIKKREKRALRRRCFLRRWVARPHLNFQK